MPLMRVAIVVHCCSSYERPSDVCRRSDTDGIVQLTGTDRRGIYARKQKLSSAFSASDGVWMTWEVDDLVHYA
jgi:hypothetical protein